MRWVLAFYEIQPQVGLEMLYSLSWLWHQQKDAPTLLTSVCIMLILREHSVFTQL